MKTARGKDCPESYLATYRNGAQTQREMAATLRLRILARHSLRSQPSLLPYISAANEKREGTEKPALQRQMTPNPEGDQDFASVNHTSNRFWCRPALSNLFDLLSGLREPWNRKAPNSEKRAHRVGPATLPSHSLAFKNKNSQRS